MKILLTSTSFQDTPGKHHEKLDRYNFIIDYLRGPIGSEDLLAVISDYDAVICGDDEFNLEVLKKGSKGKLKLLSKYGIGLDKIDLKAAKKLSIAVKNCISANHIAVSEHVFALTLSYFKNLFEYYSVKNEGNWNRLIGRELFDKKMGIIGLGRIGKEVATKALAFGMEVIVFDKFIDEDFISKHEKVTVADDLRQIFDSSDIVTLHLDLNESTKEIISIDLIKNIKNNFVLINTARAGLISKDALVYGLNTSIMKAYLTDVLDVEPIPKNHFLINYKNVFITPHIGSRNHETVERQGLMAVNNLLNFFDLE
jgi:D-3-phosphoglycerate dehydrogenase / 2-oxoglutarate reductase